MARYANVGRVINDAYCQARFRVSPGAPATYYEPGDPGDVELDELHINGNKIEPRQFEAFDAQVTLLQEEIPPYHNLESDEADFDPYEE